MMLAIALLAMLGAGAAQAQEEFVANQGLVLRDGSEARLNMTQPYVARYSRQGRSLSFVAAKHGGIEDPNAENYNADTYAAITKEFDLLKPDILIMEGVKTWDGECPPCTPQLLSLTKSEALKTEAFFAAKTGMSRVPPVPFIGGEPLNADLKAWILRRFSATQFRDFYVTNTIRGTKLSCDDAAAAAKGIADICGNFSREFSEPAVPANVQAAYVADCAKLAVENTSPDADTPSGKVNREKDFLRNKHLIQVIANMLNTHQRVLVVYGGGHHPELYYALKAMLGAPTYAE